MNTNFVFTGFDDNGNERLIYKEIDKYIDLINDTKTTPDLDLETLRFLRETVNVYKHMPKTLVKKAYNKDRKKVINCDEIYIGVESTIGHFKKIPKESGYAFYGVPLYDYHYEWENTNRKVGLYTYDSNYKNNPKFEIYKNILTGKKYFAYHNDLSSLSSFGTGFKFVDLKNKTTLRSVIKEPVLTKKRVYELANVVRKDK